VDDVMKRRNDRWNFLFIAGMWFQDLFNYEIPLPASHTDNALLRRRKS